MLRFIIEEVSGLEMTYRAIISKEGESTIPECFGGLVDYNNDELVLSRGIPGRYLRVPSISQGVKGIESAENKREYIKVAVLTLFRTISKDVFSEVGKYVSDIYGEAMLRVESEDQLQEFVHNVFIAVSLAEQRSTKKSTSPAEGTGRVPSDPERVMRPIDLHHFTFIDLDSDLERFPRADMAVLSFINRIHEHCDTALGEMDGDLSETDIAENILSALFSNGYCWHFAHMLKDTFNSGEVCWAAPFGHFVWVQNGVPYDINGTYDGESDEFIPEKYFGDELYDFLRIPGMGFNATKEEIQKIIERCRSDHGSVADEN